MRFDGVDWCGSIGLPGSSETCISDVVTSLEHEGILLDDVVKGIVTIGGHV